MQISVSVSFKNMDLVQTLKEEAESRASQLAQEFAQIRHCSVAIEAPKSGGDLCKVTIVLYLPGFGITVGRYGMQDQQHESIMQAMQDAFAAALSGLKEAEKMVHGQANSFKVC